MISRVDNPAFRKEDHFSVVNPAATTGTEANETHEDAATISDDLLRGADEIALFMFGDARMRRRVYYYARNRNLAMPVFRMGGVFCARKSSLRTWVNRQEGR
jgi:hypothetical protein